AGPNQALWMGYPNRVGRVTLECVLVTR
ncbi:hypothetical protein KIPB_014420, partial [Kipferlia bialata]